MGYTIEFELEGLPKTTNSLRSVHWTTRSKHAKLWKTAVILAVSKDKPTKPLTKAKLTLTRCSSMKCDSDGLVSSFKHIIDGLVVAEVLNDDDYEHIGMPDYRMEKAQKLKGKVRVRVEEIDTTVVKNSLTKEKVK